MWRFFTLCIIALFIFIFLIYLIYFPSWLGRTGFTVLILFSYEYHQTLNFHFAVWTGYWEILIFITVIFSFNSCLAFGFSAQANSVNEMILGRFLVGLGIGANTVLVPVYISEVLNHSWKFRWIFIPLIAFVHFLEHISSQMYTYQQQRM